MTPARVAIAVGLLAWCSLAVSTATGGQAPSANAEFAGSASCQSCHRDIYRRWANTRMANVVVDPKVHPDAIIPDLSRPDPLLTFTKNDIAFTYGSKWKQRFTKVGDNYFPLNAQWDVTHERGSRV